MIVIVRPLSTSDQVTWNAWSTPLTSALSACTVIAVTRVPPTSSAATSRSFSQTTVADPVTGDDGEDGGAHLVESVCREPGFSGYVHGYGECACLGSDEWG